MAEIADTEDNVVCIMQLVPGHAMEAK
jgi:hypothetical protein